MRTTLNLKLIIRSSLEPRARAALQATTSAARGRVVARASVKAETRVDKCDDGLTRCMGGPGESVKWGECSVKQCFATGRQAKS